MKKGLKILAVVLVVILAISVTATAFADSASYKGRCQYNFIGTNTLTKINDYKLQDRNSYTRLGSYTSSNNVRHNVAFINGGINSGAISSSGYGSGEWTQILEDHVYQGTRRTMQMQMINNTNAGTYMYAAGSWYLWS